MFPVGRCLHITLLHSNSCSFLFARCRSSRSYVVCCICAVRPVTVKCKRFTKNKSSISTITALENVEFEPWLLKFLIWTIINPVENSNCSNGVCRKQLDNRWHQGIYHQGMYTIDFVVYGIYTKKKSAGLHNNRII